MNIYMNKYNISVITMAYPYDDVCVYGETESQSPIQNITENIIEQHQNIPIVEKIAFVIVNPRTLNKKIYDYILFNSYDFDSFKFLTFYVPSGHCPLLFAQTIFKNIDSHTKFFDINNVRYYVIVGNDFISCKQFKDNYRSHKIPVFGVSRFPVNNKVIGDMVYDTQNVLYRCDDVALSFLKNIIVN